MKIIPNPEYPAMDIIVEVDRIDFHCKRCGECCRSRGDISLFPQDIPRIAKYLGMNSGDEFLKKYAIKEFFEDKPALYKYVIKDKGDYMQTCVFFDEEKKICRIHEVKPPACFYFPFVPVDYKNINSEYILQAVPCIQENELGKGKKFGEYVKETPFYEKEFEIRMRFESLSIQLYKKGYSKKNHEIYSAISKKLFEGYGINDGIKQVEERLEKAEEWAIFI